MIYVKKPDDSEYVAEITKNGFIVMTPKASNLSVRLFEKMLLIGKWLS